MIRKALNPTKGLKGTTQTYQKKNKKEHNIGIDSPEKIQICTNCTKPASECKGTCFGRY